MIIVHCCLSNFYIDNFSYQENEIVAQNVRDGHHVTVIASTESFDKDMRIFYLTPNDYIGSDGARVIRLPYARFLPQLIMRKLRINPGVYKLLVSLKPDVILFHGTCGWELNTVSRYKHKNPNVKLYVDSHEDFNNSARTWYSKWILHFSYYRKIVIKNLDHISKILCVNKDSMSFLNEFYGISEDKLEFFPLGGNLLSDSEYSKIRNNTRKKFGFNNEDLVFIQSGKIDSSKMLIESLRSFIKIEDACFSFIVVGHIQEDVKKVIDSLIFCDNRIRFLGWKTSTELRDLLCAADIYVQPGTQSATMQMSICCRCALIIDDVPSHEPYLNNNGWLVGKKVSLDEAFNFAKSSMNLVEIMSTNSSNLAENLLDYRKLAGRLYK